MAKTNKRTTTKNETKAKQTEVQEQPVETVMEEVTAMPEAETLNDEVIDINEDTDKEGFDTEVETETEDVEDNEEVSETEDIDPQAVIEEFSNAGKKIDAFVTNTTTQEELIEKVQTELAHVNEVEEVLEKKIKEKEKEIRPELKRAFTNFWMGSNDGWFM